MPPRGGSAPYGACVSKLDRSSTETNIKYKFMRTRKSRRVKKKRPVDGSSVAGPVGRKGRRWVADLEIQAQAKMQTLFTFTIKNSISQLNYKHCR